MVASSTEIKRSVQTAQRIQKCSSAAKVQTPMTKYLNRTGTVDIADACLVVGDKIEEKGADLPS
jgi:hypothetical protein